MRVLSKPAYLAALRVAAASAAEHAFVAESPMPLPLTVSRSSKIQIGFTFLVPAYPGCPEKEAVKWLCSFPGLPGWAGTRKGKTNLDFTEARDSQWQWHQLGIRKSAPRSRQITTSAPNHSVFYRPDTLPAAQPTASKQ